MHPRITACGAPYPKFRTTHLYYGNRSMKLPREAGIFKFRLDRPATIVVPHRLATLECDKRGAPVVEVVHDVRVRHRGPHPGRTRVSLCP